MSRARTSVPRALPALEHTGGIHLVGTALWCDPTAPVELAFLSSARIPPRAHRRIIATDRTLRLLERLHGKKLPALGCPLRRPFALGDLTIELFASGLLAGAAQLRARTAGGDVVYAGALALEEMRTAERAQIVPCDVLVLEASGPTAPLPPRADIEECVLAFVTRCLDAGVTPVLYAEPLGEAPEALALLGSHGLCARAHPAIYEVCRAYRAVGVEIPRVKRFRGTPGRDEVVVFPLRAESSRSIRSLKKARAAALSVEAVDPAVRQRLRADEAFPLSVDADLPALVRYVEVARPARVYATGRRAEDLARTLRRRRVDAVALLPPRQMDLF
jgi:putative mRNA 3-end processing factor